MRIVPQKGGPLPVGIGRGNERVQSVPVGGGSIKGCVLKGFEQKLAAQRAKADHAQGKRCVRYVNAVAHCAESVRLQVANRQILRQKRAHQKLLARDEIGVQMVEVQILQPQQVIVQKRGHVQVQQPIAARVQLLQTLVVVVPCVRQQHDVAVLRGAERIPNGIVRRERARDDCAGVLRCGQIDDSRLFCVCVNIRNERLRVRLHAADDVDGVCAAYPPLLHHPVECALKQQYRHGLHRAQGGDQKNAGYLQGIPRRHVSLKGDGAYSLIQAGDQRLQDAGTGGKLPEKQQQGNKNIVVAHGQQAARPLAPFAHADGQQHQTQKISQQHQNGGPLCRIYDKSCIFCSL